MLFIIEDGGVILNVFFGLVRFCFLGYSVYGMVKGVIEVMSCYLVVELGDCKIRVNILVLGVIEIDFSGGYVCDNSEVNNVIVF